MTARAHAPASRRSSAVAPEATEPCERDADATPAAGAGRRCAHGAFVTRGGGGGGGAGVHLELQATDFSEIDEAAFAAKCVQVGQS